MNFDGWLELPHVKKTVDIHINVANKKEALVKDYISLTNSQKYINCELKYKEEIAKSCVRSSLRYSTEAMDFVKYIVSDITNSKPHYSGYYVTLPYILFHLPNDKSEQGGIHTDTIKECKKQITIWTPINAFKNSYSPISLFPKSNSSLIKVFFRITNKLSKYKYVKREDMLKKIGIKRLDIYPNISTSYIWDSNLLHMGNLNSSENYHCALVLRVSKKPLYYEPSIECKDLIQRNKFKSYDFNFPELYNELYKHFEVIEKISLESPNVETFISNIYNYKKSVNYGVRKALSFALSLVSQRHSNLQIVSYFDLASYIIEKENIVSLERYLNKHNDKQAALKVLNKLSNFESFDTYQEFTLLNKFKKKFKVDAFNLKRSSILNVW